MHRNQPQSMTEMLDEHQHLRGLLDAVRESLAARRSVAAVSKMLAELAVEVAEHFRHEEAGGYFADVIEVEPRLSSRVGSLGNQHPQLAEQLKQLQQLAAAAAATAMSDDAWRDLGSRFEKFHSTFNKHETAENELLQEAYTDDIGVDD